MSDAILAADRPKVYELQICSDELYAFEPLLCDTIYHNKCRIAELRKRSVILLIKIRILKCS